MKTTLIILTLNEIDGMREIILQINPKWYDQLILLGGGSTDGINEIH